LWLQLEIAHLSLMRRDQDAFRHSLARVESTLDAWFDESDENYPSVKSRLDDLQALEVQVDVPDINQPWATLRLIREGRSRPVPSPVPVPSPAAMPEDSVQQEPAVVSPAEEAEVSVAESAVTEEPVQAETPDGEGEQ
jgi:uncharacterized protein HemX